MGILQQFDLTGKIALVTGCNKGIGKAMAIGLAEAGADIIGVSASLEPSGSDIEKEVKREGYVDNTGFFSINSRDFQGKGLSSGLLLGIIVMDTPRFKLETFAGAGYGKFLSQKDSFNNEDQNGFVDGRAGLLAGLKF